MTGTAYLDARNVVRRLTASDAIPVVLAGVDDAAVDRRADVVDEDVDGAVRVDRGAHHGGAVGSLRQVAGEDARRAALSFDDRPRLLGARGMDVGEEHACALACERDRSGLARADAGTGRGSGTGHDRDLAVDPSSTLHHRCALGPHGYPTTTRTRPRFSIRPCGLSIWPRRCDVTGTVTPIGRLRSVTR